MKYISKRKILITAVLANVFLISLILLLFFLYSGSHIKIAIYAKNDTSSLLYLNINFCGKEKQIQAKENNFYIDYLTIKRINDSSISGTLKIYDLNNNSVCCTKLNRFKEIISNNSDEISLYIYFVIVKNNQNAYEIIFDNS